MLHKLRKYLSHIVRAIEKQKSRLKKSKYFAK